MSQFEVTFKILDSKYNELIILEKYNDNYNLVMGQEGKDGNIYKRWVFPQVKGKQPSEKAIPLKITLGNRTEALAMLQAIINALMGNHQGTGINAPSEPPPRDDIPY